MNAKHKFSAIVCGFLGTALFICWIAAPFIAPEDVFKPRQYKNPCSYCGKSFYHPVDFECPNNKEICK